MSGHTKWETARTRTPRITLEELVSAKTSEQLEQSLRDAPQDVQESIEHALAHPEESVPREGRPVRKPERVNETAETPDPLGRYRVHGSFSFSSSFEDQDEARLYAERVFRMVADLPVTPHGLSINVVDRNAEPQW